MSTLSPTDRVSATPQVRPVAGHDPDGHLVTGWEPHRPVTDGLLRRFVFAYAASLAGPVAAMGGRVRQRDGHVAFDRGRPSGGFFNGIVLLQPPAPGAWPAVIEAATADLDPRGRGQFLLWSPWPTPALDGYGLRLVGHPPVLLRPAGEPEPPPPAWLRIEPVTDPETLADWERVAVEGYPLDDCRPVRPGVFVDDRILTDAGWHGWVGYARDEPVAIGTSYVAHGLQVFALGVTVPDHRGRGAWPALARRRLATFPRLPAMSLFSDHSRGPAQRLGFLPLYRWTVWSRDRP